MPSVIISSSEESESEAFSFEKQSNENISQKMAESDSEDVFISEDDDTPQKDKKPNKSTKKVTVKQEDEPKKRNASDHIKVKEESEGGAAKRRRISVKQEPSRASSANASSKKGGDTQKTTKSSTENDIPDEKSVTEDKEACGATQESVENASGSENEYSEEGEDITEFKPGQLRATPSPGYGDRVFYESLFEQNPKSFMALKWCVEHGVFSAKKSEIMLKELLIRKEEMKKGKK